MPWSGYPETMVTQRTFTEWGGSLRAHREVRIVLWRRIHVVPLRRDGPGSPGGNR
jgi:hypothetical protein